MFKNNLQLLSVAVATYTGGLALNFSHSFLEPKRVKKWNFSPWTFVFMRSCPRDIEKRERKTQNNIFKVFPPHQRKSFLSVGKILFFPHASFLQTNVRHKSLWHNTIFRLRLFGVFVCSIRMCLWQHTRISNKGVFVPAFLYVLHMDEAGDSRMKVKRGGWLESTSRVGCEWEKEGRKMSRPKKVKGMFMKMRRISEGRKKRKNTFRFFFHVERHTLWKYTGSVVGSTC